MSSVRAMLVAVAFVLGMTATAGRAGETLTYADLVGRMTDLSRLAVLPEPGEKCGQCSSYDRRSKYDETTGKYVALGRQRRRRGLHSQRGQSDRYGRDERPRLHLANLVRRGPQRPRENLPRRPKDAGCRSAVRRLLHRQDPAVQLSAAFVQSGNHAGNAKGRISTCRSRTKNRARSWPTNGDDSTISLTARFPRARMCRRSAPLLLPGKKMWPRCKGQRFL